MVSVKSIRGKIFINFTLFIAPLIILMGMLIYLYISRSTLAEITQGKLRTANNILFSLDLQVQNMDILSKEILYSNTVKDNINKLVTNKLTPSDEFNSLQQISDSLYTLMGPYTGIRQLSIFNEKLYINEGVRNKNPSADKLQEIYSSDYIKETISRNGEELILPPGKDPWETNDEIFISLTRLFKDSYYPSITAVIEVQQYYNNFKYSVESNADPKSTTLVFDSSGNVIYPYTAQNSVSKDSLSYYFSAVKSNHPSGIINKKNPNTKEDEYIAYGSSSYSDWIVVVVTTRKVIMQNLGSIKNLTFLFVISGIIIILAISYLLSRKIAKPIKQINHAIENLRIGNLTPGIPSQNKAEISELENLYEAFSDMCMRLKISINETIEARSHEAKAQFIALQAQMSPHFLYNTLTTIAVMSEEKGQKDIFIMCKRLTEMLRYISSEFKPDVSLSEELEHCRNYLYLMKMRYEDRLDYRFEVDDQILNTGVPKLILQPLLENCINHGFKSVKPPWKISVHCRQIASSCQILIVDNGVGFSEDTLKSITNQMEQYSSALKNGNEPASLQIGGMALISIFARLKLLHKDNLVFKINSIKGAGTEIIIEIPLH
jgi:Predicted signal transduction protein with a C-terminal ATPase domain